MKEKYMKIYLVVGLLCAGFFSFQKPVQATEKPTIFVVGDSKARYATKGEYPRMGWVQELVKYFKGPSEVKVRHPQGYKGQYRQIRRYYLDDVYVENWSKGGNSLKEFKRCGRAAVMLRKMKKGDYVLLATGHNEGKDGQSISSYKKYLTWYIKKIKAKGATPIVVTTTPSCREDQSKVSILFPKYWRACKQVAKKHNITCVDLNQECVNFFNYSGKKKRNQWYLNLRSGKWKNYPKGIHDPIHYTKSGAQVVAKIIVVGLQKDSRQRKLTTMFKTDSRSLYRTYQKAKGYSKGRYTTKSWNQMVKARNRTWRVLYSPKASNRQYQSTQTMLEKAMEKLRRR